MSGAAAGIEPGDRRVRVPERLRPRERERRGRGDLRRVESTLLVLAFLLLAVATVNDVVEQAHVNERLMADVRTWRTVTGRDYRKISIKRDLTYHTTRDLVCGNTSPAPPGTVTRVCLIVTGPTAHGLRAAKGGFYLPPYLPDRREDRYGCFGTAVGEDLCGRPTPKGAPHEPLTGAR